MAPYFTSLNRNKRPVVFNLKKSDESHATQSESNETPSSAG